MPAMLLTNATVFDGVHENCREGMQVLIDSGVIREVAERIDNAVGAQAIDLGGRTLMPGLIDAHIHAYASDLNLRKVDQVGEAYRTAHAIRMLGHALDCGFTTVRDVGGGDYGLWRAIEDRLFKAPRFFYAGKIISMTGGHGDFRQMTESRHDHGYCSCGAFNSVSVIADGVDECVKATREELRRGAHCIKIMGSGGVVSPTDPIWMNQYREDEIRAIVNETVERRTYTSAHCHSSAAVRRCVEFGVRVIEHGTLMDDETASFVEQRGAFVVPTVVMMYALAELGPKLGFPASSQEKADYIRSRALEGLHAMRRAGVKVGFGTDLIGDIYSMQCREFSLRREVFTPFEILKQATSVNAEILMQKDILGCVKEGATADLLVVEGNPLENIELLAADGKHLRLILRGGEVVRNNLS